MSYYSRFNKNLANVDQVITNGDVVRAIARGLGRRGNAVGETFRVTPVYTPGELAERDKEYIDLERDE